MTRPRLDRAVLTPTELAVLELVARGLSNPEVAIARHLSQQSIKNCVVAIMKKLDANNRTHAVYLAHERGLLAGVFACVLPVACGQAPGCVYHG